MAALVEFVGLADEHKPRQLMAVVTISQTWADGSQLCVQVGSNNHAGYPDELNQFRHEAVAAFKELVVEGSDDEDDDD